MTDSANDSAPPTAGKGQQRTPPQGQKRRNRKNTNNNNANNHTAKPSDGAVSDGALINSAQSSQKSAHRQRQSVAIPVPNHQDNATRKASAQKTRNISAGAALQPNTPAKEQAYAGPTFQASPAASALPVPKFFSRSVPNVAVQPSLQGRMAGEKTPESNSSSPESDAVSPVPPSRQMQRSPLDLFFKADRAEKEKSRSNSETLSPAAAARLPQQPATMPRNSHAHPGRSIFLQELDGDDLPSPRTNPPSARPHFDRAHSSPGNPTGNTDDQRQISTQNLKDLLFNTAASASTSSPIANSPRSMYNHPSSTPNPHSPVSNFNSPSPFHNGYGHDGIYNPTTPQSQPHQQSQYNNPNNANANGNGNANYHYGNRNLSPLFKAAARETPPRPSSLRQEIGSPGYGNENGVNGHGNGNGVAREYLDQQIRASAPPELPEFGFRPQSGGAVGGNGGQVNGGGGAGNGGVQGQGKGGQDLRVMEDDLRRILKLDVAG
ncbi:unnamed protein product [Zymoseptoria tritici ST99CH_3D1]|nr:unnamed protein product [Zymoseptoria tritici ST99CH_3D1]